jgi:DNA-binding NarL/FixJ family response regulator
MAKQLCETRPEIGVLILTQHADPSLALELFETRSAGRAYLLKEQVANRGELVAAIRALADRRPLVDPSIVDGLMAERARPPASPPDGLTAREREVLAEVSTGKSDSAIACSLSSPGARSRSTSTRSS